MNKAKNAFLAHLDMNGIIFDDIEPASNWLRVSYGGDNIARITLTFSFSEDEERVSIKVHALAKVHKKRRAQVLEAINKANSEYRWVVFYIDEANELTASFDAVLPKPDWTGDICEELIRRLVNIIDEVYPSFMEALWGEEEKPLDVIDYDVEAFPA